MSSVFARRMWIVAGVSTVIAAVSMSLLLGCGGGSNNNPVAPGPGPGLELNSGNLPPGRVFQHTFANAGTFPYHCTIHAAMTGNSVTVDAGSAIDSAFVQIVSMATPGYSPSS